MPGMTVGGDESAWRRLGTALNQARQAGDGDHRLLGAHPVFYAAEQTGDRWLLLGDNSLTPQQARGELAHQFLLRAADAADDSREQHDYRAAADVLDRERHDQMTTAGRHFQIVRAAQFLLMGPDGPEPPRPTGKSVPGSSPGSTPELSFPGEADSDTSATTAALKASAATCVLAPGNRPADVIADERRALNAYPQVTMLGTWYATGEHDGHGWHQPWPTEHPTLAGGRDWLISYFREYAPAWENPSPQERAAYADAATALERDHGYEVTAAERRFHITPVYRVIRMNGTRPEPPRPSDFDPYPPPAT
jgi:hypothetical protein